MWLILNGLIPNGLRVAAARRLLRQEDCFGKKTAAARRLLRQEDCCGKKIAAAKRNARHSHQGSRASVLMWHRGEIARDSRSLLALRRHAQGPKHNARPLASLFLLISVTPASQFLLTTRGRILVRCTNPEIAERKALQKESSPRQLPAAGFSYFGSVWPRNAPGPVLTLCHALCQLQTRDTFRSLGRWGCRVARSESAGRFYATHLYATPYATHRTTVRAGRLPPRWRS